MSKSTEKTGDFRRVGQAVVMENERPLIDKVKGVVGVVGYSPWPDHSTTHNLNSPKGFSITHKPALFHIMMFLSVAARI